MSNTINIYILYIIHPVYSIYNHYISMHCLFQYISNLYHINSYTNYVCISQFSYNLYLPSFDFITRLFCITSIIFFKYLFHQLIYSILYNFIYVVNLVNILFHIRNIIYIISYKLKILY